MFEIEFADDATLDLEGFRKFEQAQIFEEIERHLPHEPEVETKKRKRLRPGHITEWELRIGNIRVFYDVEREGSIVTVARIGLKQRNKLLLRGEEFTP